MQREELNGVRRAIVNRLAASAKYRTIYRKTVLRAVNNCATERCSRNLLHQIWGAYYGNRPNFTKLLRSFEYPLENRYSQEENLKRALALHASTRERLPFLDEFYGKIFELTGTPQSIIDHACGLNPLTLPWMSLAQNAEYRAYDIDTEAVEFLNRVLALVAPGANARVAAGDILADRFPHADVAFLLKLLPVLEHQRKGASVSVLKKQKCEHVVVSFSRETIGGRDVGMTEFYRTWFRELIAPERWDTEEILFPAELVFVIRKY